MLLIILFFYRQKSSLREREEKKTLQYYNILINEKYSRIVTFVIALYIQIFITSIDDGSIQAYKIVFFYHHHHHHHSVSVMFLALCMCLCVCSSRVTAIPIASVFPLFCLLIFSMLLLIRWMLPSSLLSVVFLFFYCFAFFFPSVSLSLSPSLLILLHFPFFFSEKSHVDVNHIEQTSPHHFYLYASIVLLYSMTTLPSIVYVLW